MWITAWRVLTGYHTCTCASSISLLSRLLLPIAGDDGAAVALEALGGSEASAAAGGVMMKPSRCSRLQSEAQEAVRGRMTHFTSHILLKLKPSVDEQGW